MKHLVKASVLLVLVFSFSPIGASGADLLDARNGASIVSASSEYGGSWVAQNLIDKTTGGGWCSVADSTFPHTIIIDLNQNTSIEEFVIDNTGAQESGYPGISARGFELYFSTISKDYGYRHVLESQAGKETQRRFKLDRPESARWIKLVITSNWGNPNYTELMKVGAYGTASMPERSMSSILDGASVISVSSEYGGSWLASMLFDNKTASGWCSSADSPFPHTIVIGLARSATIRDFVIDNTDTQESGYPGISARRFELYGSSSSSNSGFRLLLEGQAAQGKRKAFELDSPSDVRYLKLVILSNYGNPNYTEIMELEAHGE